MPLDADCFHSVLRASEIDQANWIISLVPIGACNTCHGEQMHGPTEASGATEVSAPIAADPSAE